MKPFKILTLLCASLLLQACSSPEVKAVADAPEFTDQFASHFNGQLVLGAKTRVFTPCDSHIQYQIKLSKTQIKQILPHLKHPYDELYVELTGHLSVPSQTGYNADYQAILHTQQINTVKPSGSTCQSFNDNLSKHWIGHYAAQSTTSDLITSLELNPDHSARTIYRYNNGDLPVVESGFWQPISNHQVQVTMTLYQQQYLVTERIFTQKDNALFADKEKIGEKEYSITQGGLLLFRDK